MTSTCTNCLTGVCFTVTIHWHVYA